MIKNVAVIPGDGIGPEITAEAVRALKAVAVRFGHTFRFETVAMGGDAVDRFGEPLPAESLRTCFEGDAVLLGAVGGPKWDNLPAALRPEKGLLSLRAGLGLYANLRPAKILPMLAGACPLKNAGGIDLLIVRELTGGVYFGKKTREGAGPDETATDRMAYSRKEIERIGRVAFRLAAGRRGKLTSVDKANVLETSRLWREVMHGLAQEHPAVEYADMLVDNCAMQLVRNPAQFDVVVTENMFGDILSDEASMITGSIGMLPSASLGDGTHGLYEPIHGSAPDIAGLDLANPIGTVLSAAMMLRWSFDMREEADLVEKAVETVLAAGYRTGDILTEGATRVGTCEMGGKIAEAVASI